MDEADRIFSKDSRIACIVSIGTGKTGSLKYDKPVKWQKWVATQIVEVLVKLVTDSETTAERMTRRYRNKPGVYYRFDVDRGLNAIALGEWQRLGDVRLHTENYMRLEEVSKNIDEVVAALSGTSNKKVYEVAQLGK